jgi:hypothetical protein
MNAPLWQHLAVGLAALGAAVWLVRRAFGGRRDARGPCAACAAQHRAELRGGRDEGGRGPRTVASRRTIPSRQSVPPGQTIPTRQP